MGEDHLAEDIINAARMIREYILETPLIKAPKLLCASDDQTVLLKCENMQHGGSFKVRGALHAVRKALMAEKAGEPVTFFTHSSGNHGRALAFAAATFHRSAVVVVPRDAPSSKVDAMRALGATLVMCEPTQQSRESVCANVQKSLSCGNFVHPFDDRRVIAGQGTLGLDILEQCGDAPDAVLVAVGGGGLASGVAVAIKSRHPRVAVWGVEPATASDAARSLALKRRVGHIDGQPHTIADALRMPLSERTFNILRQHLDGILVVSEDDIRHAMRVLLVDGKILVEPSGAVALAAVRAHAEKLRAYRKLVVVLCGGNVDLKDVPRLASKSQL